MSDPMRVQLDRANGSSPAQSSQGKPAVQNQTGMSFADALNKVQDVRFSTHAQKRLQSRQINLSEESVNRLSEAVDKAEKKGGQSSLVLVDDLAFIVNVRDRVVVTALDTNQRGEGVFTQIDSVVFADPAAQQMPRSTIDRKC